MKEFIKRMALTGIGFASLGKEKIEDMAKDISENLGISEEEGRKVAEEIIDEARNAGKDAEKNARETANKVLGKMDIPTSADIQKLEDRIKKLEKTIAELKKA